jgi:hypothetical protein
MASSASARCSWRYDYRSGRDHNRRTTHVSAAPAIGPAMEAGTAASCYLDYY